MGKGLARMNSAVTTLDFPLTASSLSPTTSGTGGKLILIKYFLEV
jgi:hypothetical protein